MHNLCRLNLTMFKTWKTKQMWQISKKFKIEINRNVERTRTHSLKVKKYLEAQLVATNLCRQLTSRPRTKKMRNGSSLTSHSLRTCRRLAHSCVMLQVASCNSSTCNNLHNCQQLAIPRPKPRYQLLKSSSQPGSPAQLFNKSKLGRRPRNLLNRRFSQSSHHRPQQLLSHTALKA